LAITILLIVVSPRGNRHCGFMTQRKACRRIALLPSELRQNQDVSSRAPVLLMADAGPPPDPWNFTRRDLTPRFGLTTCLALAVDEC
jgi:hypothetical protein